MQPSAILLELRDWPGTGTLCTLNSQPFLTVSPPSFSALGVSFHGAVTSKRLKLGGRDPGVPPALQNKNMRTWFPEHGISRCYLLADRSQCLGCGGKGVLVSFWNPNVLDLPCWHHDEPKQAHVQVQELPKTVEWGYWSHARWSWWEWEEREIHVL